MRGRFYTLLFLAVFTPFFAIAATCPTLSRGMSGPNVSAVQKVLYDAYQGFPTPTGYFGSLTEAAVKQWQSEHGIEKTGTVGPKTRAAMKFSCAPSTSSTVTKPTTQSSTAALIQALLAQVKILQEKIAALLAASTTASIVVQGISATPAPPVSPPAFVTPVQTVTTSQISSDKYWFAPLPAVHFSGSTDYMSLFQSGALWQQAASRIQVFKLYGEWLQYASDADLQQVVSDLKHRGIKLAIEIGPLTPTATCGSGVEGFTAQYWPQYAKRIKAVGGTVDYVDMDTPYFYGHWFGGAQACNWSADKIATDVASFIKTVHGDFPNAVVGDIEPLITAVAGNTSEFQAWFDAFKRANGSALPYLHLDVQWDHDWPTLTKSIETVTKQNGIIFGIIYNAATETTDKDWITAAGDHVKTYELSNGGAPDRILFQSWYDKPDYILPETAPFTFAGLIDQYFTDKTKLGSSAQPRGWLENVTCPTIPGWVQDTDTPEIAIDVHLYFDGPAGTPGLTPVIVSANQYRADLCTPLGSCAHAFSAPIPAQYLDGANHSIYAYGINSGAGDNSVLSGSPVNFRCTQ